MLAPMSSFATFRKCDFQVHSCRDPNWRGARPVGLGDKLPDWTNATEADVEAARKTWANGLVDLLHGMKHMRQLLFSTHNANLVVNGAAKFVTFTCNNDAGHRVVEHRGSIDQPDVRLAITETMEGGEKAFKDRQRKYGF
jgi:hypothetical protein